MSYLCSPGFATWLNTSCHGRDLGVRPSAIGIFLRHSPTSDGLQEMIAAGWSNAELGAAVRELLGGWVALLAEVAREAERRHGPLGPLTAEEAATLVGSAFLGAEVLLLLGFDREVLPIRSALRRIGVLIRLLEERESSHTNVPL